MRFVFVLLFVLWVQFGSAQTYAFELLTQYDSDFGDHKHELVAYSNPGDATYFMYLTKYETGTLARLSDFSRRVIHVFSINESKSDIGETLFEFSYKESIDFGESNSKECKVVYDSEIIASDSTSKTIVVRQFKNTKKKKVLTTATLTIKNHEKNLFPLFCFSAWYGVEWRDWALSQETGLVESATFAYKKQKSKIKLSYIKKTVFELSVPAELIKKPVLKPAVKMY